MAATAKAGGSFRASDDGLTRIWDAAVQTAGDASRRRRPRLARLHDLGSRRHPRQPDPRPLPLRRRPRGHRHDPARSRNDVAGARGRRSRGLPPCRTPTARSPTAHLRPFGQVLVDYNAYWVETLYDYTLYTGDLTLLSTCCRTSSGCWTSSTRRTSAATAILLDWIGELDYAYTVRGGPEVAYYDAQYVRVLGLASRSRPGRGIAADAAAWLRGRTRHAPFCRRLLGSRRGAFSDTTATPSVHTLDGNVFAILAGAATAQQEDSALRYIAHTMARPEGDAVVDTPGWNAPTGTTTRPSTSIRSSRTTNCSRCMPPATTPLRSS